jgi:hypothetical protein
MKQMMKPNVPLKTRQNIYQAARKAAGAIVAGNDSATLTVGFEKRSIGMPRQLGFEEGTHSGSIVVRINMKNKMDRPPE